MSPRYPHECLGCNEVLYRSNQRWCSGACRSLFNYRKDITTSREKQRKTFCKVYFEPCEICGDMKTWRYARRLSRVCGKSCQRVANARRMKAAYDADPYAARERMKAVRAANPEAGRVFADRRRARLASVEREDFSRLEIYLRDGWQCGLCGAGIEPWRSHPDPLAVSLDHVVPLSLGGGHTRANTRAAHYICNVRRGDRLGVRFDLAA